MSHVHSGVRVTPLILRQDTLSWQFLAAPEFLLPQFQGPLCRFLHGLLDQLKSL